MGQTTNKSIFAELWERRLPQFFATYIGVCWGFLQFLNFACQRYKLDDGLIDKFLLFVAILIPAVLLFIYNHGKPGKDQWTKFEKIFIPSNLAIATLIALLLGGSQKAAATSTAVEITTEEGEQITRIVPSASQTRKLALFPFELKSDKEEWCKFAFPLLLSMDLEQDMRIFTLTPKSLDYHFQSFDYSIDNKLPFSTKLQIANKTKVDYFVTGDINFLNDEWIVNLKVHESGSGEVLLEKSHTGITLFEVVDACTDDITDHLFLSENQTDYKKTVDFPASDLITGNTKALADYMAARHYMYYDNDYEKAAPLIHQASQEDLKSAEIKTLYANVKLTLGDKKGAQSLISEALKLSKQLPERQQFTIKRRYWNLQDHTDNVMLLMNNWVKLYPQDFEPYKELMNFYSLTYNLGKAKSIGLLAIENGHRNRVLADMVDLSIKLEDFDQAQKYLSEYHANYPEVAKEDTRLADIYIKSGEITKAKSFYDARLLDDPQNSKLYRNMAAVFATNGEHQKSIEHYEQALTFAVQAADSANIYQHLLIYQAGIGQTEELIATSDRWMNAMRRYLPEMGVASHSLQLGGIFAIGGAEKHLFEYYNKVGTDFPQMKPVFECVSNIVISLFKGDPDVLKKYYQGSCKAIVLQGTPDMKYLIEGFLNSMEGKHEASITSFNTFIEKSGAGGKDLGYLLAREYRLMEQPDKAIKACEDFLKTAPYNGIFLLELAMAQVAQLDFPAARKSYSKLEKIWADADPRFHYYDDFIELGKQLESK